MTFQQVDIQAKYNAYNALILTKFNKMLNKISLNIWLYLSILVQYYCLSKLGSELLGFNV